MNNRLTTEKISFLENIALSIRIDAMRAISAAKSGHTTTCLSSADIISTLFFHTMKMDLKNPKNRFNDRFILSAGHGIPSVYAAWKHLGVIDDAQLMSLRQFDSVLEGHPTPRFSYNEAATGSLGQGLGVAAGMALYARAHQLSYTTYVMMGDGEVAEGSIWEAASFCSTYKMANIVGIINCNRLAQSGTSLDAHATQTYQKKWDAFGWKTFVIDGHDIRTIANMLDKVANIQDQPIMIIAKTLKGYGLPDIQDKNGFHGKPIPAEELEQRVEQLKHFFPNAQYQQTCHYIPELPINNKLIPVDTADFSLNLATDENKHLFDATANMATRKAFGYALASLCIKNKNIYTLDADVGNSTFTEFVQKAAEKQFIQCYIMEQNMISVATGLQARGIIPFAATFAAFFTRAFDQIRMAAIGRNALRLAGSHAGVSIGEDGPSQMGLEDLALFTSLPNSIVLYPSDAVSTYKLVDVMARYNDGISYMRTTRATTPILYDEKESFEIGGSKLLRQSNNDVACVVAAGITLHEALKAHETLKADNINISVVDLYCIKPLDVATLIKTAHTSNNTIITVEDHYRAGGIGQTVATALCNHNISVHTLAVNNISRSGTPADLMRDAQIDAQAIVELVKNSLTKK